MPRCLYAFFNSTRGGGVLDWQKVGRCGLEMFAWRNETEETDGRKKENKVVGWEGGVSISNSETLWIS